MRRPLVLAAERDTSFSAALVTNDAAHVNCLAVWTSQAQIVWMHMLAKGTEAVMVAGGSTFCIRLELRALFVVVGGRYGLVGFFCGACLLGGL